MALRTFTLAMLFALTALLAGCASDVALRIADPDGQSSRAGRPVSQPVDCTLCPSWIPKPSGSAAAAC